ncbi:hypothetical protein HPB50_027690 [Hyalomma asiaticum]|nr:hypothetical protein HPB50_027690 [Hyalomma asiaticum]
MKSSLNPKLRPKTVPTLLLPKEVIYKERQAALFSSVAGMDIDLAGDARCDSPGHNAKYGTYVVLGAQVQLFLHCEQHQSAAVPNSNAMEREGLVRTLLKLESLGIKVRSLTTGCSLYCLLHIDTLECGHTSANSGLTYTTTLTSGTLPKQVLGDENLIVSMWRSLLNQICNRHTNHDGPFTKCLHEPLLDKAWMTRGYVQELLEDVVGRVLTSSHKKSSMENPPEPRKFLTDDYEAPPMEDLIATHKSRFSGAST